jgi:hypothetical protein
MSPLDPLNNFYNRRIVKSNQNVSLSDHLKGNNTDWVVWWFGGFLKSSTEKTQPDCKVVFRELKGNQVSEETFTRRIPITSLGHVRIGTIWKNARLRQEMEYDQADFKVDFTEGSWKITSFREASRTRNDLPYPPPIHPLQYGQMDLAEMIEFPLSTGGKLVIPCIEFFTRCYGSSAELRRIISTYGWEEALNQRLLAPQEEPEEPDIWKVKLRRRLVNDDVTFLAHVKYDPYAERSAKSIYAQLEKSHKSEKGYNLCFIEARPWFQGPADIRVRGIWFDNQRSFLGLQVAGCSDPKGLPIERDREDRHYSDRSDRGENDDGAEGGVKERLLAKLPQIIDLTGDEDPDSGSAKVEILDPAFVKLGEARVIFDVRGQLHQGTPGTKWRGVSRDKFSGGDSHGSGKGVGRAAIHAEAIMESEGILLDMWKALLFMKEKHKEIETAEWFTFKTGFLADKEPKLISLEPFNNATEIKDANLRNWPYFDIATLTSRGVLVMRTKVAGKMFYMIEIQRRPRKTKKKDGTVKPDEQKFQGLIFTLKDQNRLSSWLRRFLADIRPSKGVMSKLAGKCPGMAKPFNHSSARSGQVSCEAAILNAFRIIGISLTENIQKQP